MGIQFGLIDSLDTRVKNKRLRLQATAERALTGIDGIRRAMEEDTQ